MTTALAGTTFAVPGWRHDDGRHAAPRLHAHILDVVSQLTGADLVAIAIPSSARHFVLVEAAGARAPVYRGMLISSGVFTFDPSGWAHAMLSWCSVDHVIPGAPHALFTPVAGFRSPPVALMIANHSWGRPFREHHARLLVRLALHPRIAAAASACSAIRSVWGAPTGGRVQ